MSNLFGSISIAMSSMLAQQSAISVTANNVSNINTPGYSRQRAELTEGDSVMTGTRMVGTGVTLSKITSLRDRVLELRIDAEKQQQGALQAQVNSLSDIEVMFSSDTTNLGDSINIFFNSLSDLSSDPSSVPLRQTVLMNANNLANGFQNTAVTLQQRQSSLDQDIQQSVTQINQIAKQIADLNRQISAMGSTNEDQIGAFVDQRTSLLGNLSDLIGNQVTTGDDGLTVTTANGTPLVVGTRSFDLRSSKNADGSPRISSGGEDITGSITGGKLEGLLSVRNTVIPGILGSLDTLASDLANTFNTAHGEGFDLKGNAGADFFVAPPVDGKGAAISFAVNIADPSLLAASSDGTAGSNGNVNNLIAVRGQRNANGNTPLDQYAGIAFNIGSRIANANTELNASELIGQQLSDQRGALSGVSLDEEAADLVRFQRAYEAAARVLTVISDMTEVSVNLGRN
jgi:flagellar hook-associated protein 1 FlgK